MAYEIPIDVTKVEALAKAFGNVADQVDRVDGKIAGLNGSMGQTVTKGGRVVQAASNPADVSASSPVAESVRRSGRSSSIDPYNRMGVRERLDYETAVLERARDRGDDRLFRDQQNRVMSAQKAVDRAEKALAGPKSRDEILEDILNTSRIGRNGALYPLVGKLRQLQTAEGSAAASESLAALGIGGGIKADAVASLAGRAAGGVLVGGAIAAGGAALYGFANAGAERMRRANEAFYQLGGSPDTVGAAMALGGENAAAKAMAFGDRLREGSYGSAFFRSRGIYDRGAYQVDKGSNYVAGLEALRSVSDVQERIRIARDTGLTDDFWTTNLSDRSFNRLKNSRAAAGTPQEMQAEAEYRAKKERAGNYIDRAWRGLSEPLIDAFGDSIGTAMFDGDAIGKTIRRGLNAIPFGSTFGTALDAAQTAFEGRRKPSGGRGGKPNGPKWQNVDPNIGESPVNINGTTAGAIPVGWRGRALNEDLDRLNRMMGAF